MLAAFVTEELYAQKLAGKTSHHHCCYLDQIVIEGKTNVNQFNFIFDNARYHVVSIDEQVKQGDTNKEFVEFEIPVKGFKGDNSLMENDFYELLKVSNYPHIVVGIEKLILQKIVLGTEHLNLYFYITIAGNTKQVKGQYVTYFRNDHTLLSGKAKIRLTEFSLDPPQKMMGMLKVKDEIFITFDISLASSQTLVKR
jgi:hypothetical protein